jgi:hypothetical protein
VSGGHDSRLKEASEERQVAFLNQHSFSLTFSIHREIVSERDQAEEIANKKPGRVK